MGRKPEIILEKKRMNIGMELSKAETANLYCIQTEGNNFGYVYDDGWIAVITPAGHFRMRLDRAVKFSREFADICTEITDLVDRRILE